MCYAIPGRIVGLKGNIAVVDYFGERRNVLNEYKDVKEGDYVYAQGGVIVSRIGRKEAVHILNFWKDKFFELKRVDSELAGISKAGKVSADILAILQKINLNKRISKKELLTLLEAGKEEELNLIFETANSIRQKEHDNACCVHGIIEFSNHCRNDCEYCGIRKSSKIKRYRMSPGEIINTARHAVDELGFRALVLQSGEDLWYDEEKLIRIVAEIRKLGVLIFLSIGVRSRETYKKLYKAGAKAVLLRFETSNKEIFNRLRPGTGFEERINLIRYLRKMGYIIATGFIMGLPGESTEDILNNILLTKSLEADMHSFGPLIPAKGTMLENQKIMSKDAVLKTIAVTRFIDRKAKILVTTALETLGKGAKKQGLMAGANSLMINVTPPGFRKQYTIYPGRPDRDKEITGRIEDTLRLLYSIGRAPTDLGARVD